MLPAEGEWFDETLVQVSPDVLREMVVRMAQMMVDAEVGQRCGAGYGEVSDQRINSRNGYRRREWDTRAGTVVHAFAPEDNGVGVGETGRRSGLRNIEERAARLGGTAELETPENGGTRLRWQVPL
ncbi:transposase [Nonomuraea sp. CA-141351]|uniref:transposase n=1 Tax=Nonomuraea sp. CA-141351 TaxID=3239996 RepID=UPI003D918027